MIDVTMNVSEVAKKLGCSTKELQQVVDREIYRRKYNRREDVIEKRRLYNQKRNQEMKQIREMLKEGYTLMK